MTTTNAQHTPGDMIRVHGKRIKLAEYIKSHDALLAALEGYRDECRTCGGTGIYRVKKGGQGRPNRREDFIESPCTTCEPARAAIRAARGE